MYPTSILLQCNPILALKSVDACYVFIRDLEIPIKCFHLVLVRQKLQLEDATLVSPNLVVSASRV